jgi:hypothetical protein
MKFNPGQDAETERGSYIARLENEQTQVQEKSEKNGKGFVIR